MDSLKQNQDLITGLKHFYDMEDMCDCTVMSMQGSISCHRIVLASTSSYLRTIILENPSSHNESRIECTDFSQQDLKTVISYIYTGKCEIDIENVYSLLKISYRWQLNNIYEKCVAFVQCHLADQNITKFHELACEQQHFVLKEKTSRYLRKCFGEVDNFSELSLNTFHTLLQYDEINCQENQICEKVIDWIKNNPHPVDYHKLCKAIRFDHLSSDYLHEVKDIPVMQSPETQELITLALSYQKNNEKHGCLKEIRCWVSRETDQMSQSDPSSINATNNKYQQTIG